MSFRKQIKLMNKKIQEHNEKMKPIKEMELFVLDNSLRESTVAQLRGHTIENKWKIYEEVSHVLFLIWTPKWKLRGGLVKSISAGQSMIHVLPSFVLILLSPFFCLILFTLPFPISRLVSTALLTWYFNVSPNHWQVLTIFSRFAIFAKSATYQGPPFAMKFEHLPDPYQI